MMEENYGKRKCMTCGKTFVAMFHTQICCSEECRQKRHRETTARSSRKRRELIKQRMENMEKIIERLKKENEELKKELEKYRNTTEPNKEQEETKELIKQIEASKPQKVQKRWCERLKINSVALPCGQKKECFVEPKCDKIPPELLNGK